VQGRVVIVREYSGRIDAALTGPANQFREGSPAASVPLTVHVDHASNAAAIEVGERVLVLQPGEWSDFVRVKYSLLPMGLSDVSGVVRFYLRSLSPEFELYASPVNIDPSDPVAPVSEPASASAELVSGRRGRPGIGPFYTQGMPEDVNALKRDLIDDAEFVQQASLVHDEGVRMLHYALDRFQAQERGGLLFFYFSGVDLCCHMLWRHHDATHPHHDAAFSASDSSAWTGRPGSRWKDMVYEQYLRMDPVLGLVVERFGPETTVIVMSDHGFAPYARKFNLNTWLWKQGYLVLLPDFDPSQAPVLLSQGVDWSKTRAYGVGFNGLYLNLAGRERDDPRTADRDESGIVPAAQSAVLLAEISAKLTAMRDPARNGAQIVLRADPARDIYSVERLAEAPDLLVGYNSGYGNSDEASLGEIGPEFLVDNDRGGTFNGSHLMAPEVVAGVLMTNRKIAAGAHGLQDLTVEILRQFGLAPAPGMTGRPVFQEP
jgi:predicted AlkP superfamily phosphohydrolase/phosphomutase